MPNPSTLEMQAEQDKTELTREDIRRSLVKIEHLLHVYNSKNAVKARKIARKSREELTEN